MDIIISQGHHPPANPDGITVVIDVIRAFTTAHFAFEGGLTRSHLVATADAALAMKTRHPHLLLAGEIEALPIEGFDFGNSPWEISSADLRGRELVQRTTNGVIATLNARNSGEVLVGALVNAGVTARYILSRRPSRVVLVASHPSGDEDVACAEYLQGLLGGAGISPAQAEARTMGAAAAVKFLDGRHPRLHAEDIALAARVGAPDQGRPLRVRFEPEPCIEPVDDASWSGQPAR